MSKIEEELVDFACSLCRGSDLEELRPATVDPSQPLRSGAFDCTNFGHGAYYRIVRCRHCQMIFSSPRPPAVALIAAYGESVDSTYVAEEEGRRRTAARVLKRMLPHRGRLLDVGCNSGVFLEVARGCGFECFGVEPSRFASRRAREVRKLDVCEGGVPGALPWSEPFDVITLWDVIEHVDDPLEVVAFLRECLVEGGSLHMSTIDIGSLYARLSGPHWPWLMRMHIQYFTRETVERMLCLAGYREVRFQSYSHIVKASYLSAKLPHLAAPLRLLGQLGIFFLRSGDGFVRVNMGDMMHVIAVR